MDVLFIVDFERGHVVPTFAFADALEAAGHRVRYLAAVDLQATIRAAGFEAVPLFADIYPAGSVAAKRELVTRQLARLGLVSNRAHDVRLLDHLVPLIRGALDDALATMRPSVVVMSYFLSVEALILMCRSDLRMAMFTPYLRPPEFAPHRHIAAAMLEMTSTVAAELMQLASRRRGRLSSLQALGEPLIDVPELVACPREFDLPDVDLGAGVHYIGPCIRASRPQPRKSEVFAPAGYKVICVSFGSQTALLSEKATAAYRVIFELVRRAADERWHFVVALGAHLAREELSPVTDNVTVVPWLSQMEVLECADAMICHGGLGGIKECIYSGVPMVVIPLDRDQPANAKRVVHHRTGIALELESLDCERLFCAVKEVLSSDEIRSGVDTMRHIFHRNGDLHSGVAVIERAAGQTFGAG